MNALVRRLHRWLSLAFTVAVVANIGAMFLGLDPQTGMWIGLGALVPLIPLLFSGLYLFVLPYLPKRAMPG